MKIIITADPAIPVPPIHYGGIERIIAMLIDELVQRGHDVTLIAHKESKVPCTLIPYPGLSQSKLDVLKNALTVSKAVIGKKFEVIHSFGRLAYLSFLLPLRIQKIMSYQREPSVSQVKLAMKLAKKNTLVFTGCSEYIAQKIRPFAPSYAILNFVDLSKYDLMETTSPDAPLMFLGRVENIKGAHLCIQLAQSTKKKLIIAGNIPEDDEHKTYYEEKIKPYVDGNQIKYIGPVNDYQKNELLGKALAFLMLIIWDEPFGIVMPEAMACGTPVIGFPRGAVPEVVEDGVNGFICNNLDEAILKIPDCSKIDRKKVRKTVEEKFSKTGISTSYLDLYRNFQKYSKES